MPPSMEDRFQDILRSTAKIEMFIEGRSFEDFVSDEMRYLATERLLGIACEAALKLPDSVKQSAPKTRSPHERSDMRDSSPAYRCAHAGYDRLAISPNRSALASGRHFHPEIDEAAERFGA